MGMTVNTLEQKTAILALLDIGTPAITQQLKTALASGVAETSNRQPVTLGQTLHHKVLDKPATGQFNSAAGNFALGVQILSKQLINTQFKLHCRYFNRCAVLHQQLVFLRTGQQPAGLITQGQTAKYFGIGLGTIDADAHISLHRQPVILIALQENRLPVLQGIHGLICRKRQHIG